MYRIGLILLAVTLKCPVEYGIAGKEDVVGIVRLASLDRILCTDSFGKDLL
jgi:hypothetical protein